MALTLILQPFCKKLVIKLLAIDLKNIMEGLLGISIIITINLIFFFDDPGFTTVDPNPFWIVIIPMAARYGFNAGFWTSFGAGFSYLCLIKLGAPNIPFKELFATTGLKLPIIFLTIGIIIGEIRETQKNRYVALKSKLTDIEERFESLGKQYDILSKAKEELDTRIISQEQTLSTLYESAQSLKSLEEKDIYPSVLDLLKEYMVVEEASIYVFSDEKLILKACTEKENKPRYNKEISNPSGMMAEVIKNKKIVSINTLISSSEFASFDSKIVSPILDSKQNLLGLITIEYIPFLKFTPQSVKMADLIGEWTGSAIETARTYQETKDRNISDEITGAYTHKYFQNRINEEFSRAKRYKVPLCMLIYEIVDFHLFSEKIQHDITTVLNLVFHNKLRTIDLLCNGENLSQYIIVLPNTPIEGGRVVKQKILSEIDTFKFKPYESSNELLQIRVADSAIITEMKSGIEFYKETLSQFIIDTTTGLYNYSYLVKKLQDDYKNDPEFKSNYPVIEVQIEDYTKFSGQSKKDIATVLSLTFRKKFSTTNFFSHHRRANRFVLLLQGMLLTTVKETTKQVADEIKSFKLQPYNDSEDFLKFKLIIMTLKKLYAELCPSDACLEKEDEEEIDKKQ